MVMIVMKKILKEKLNNMQIIETAFPETLHQFLRSSLLSSSLYSSTKTEWFVVLQNRKVLNAAMLKMFEPIESWVKANFFPDIISYNFDGYFHTGKEIISDEGELIDWHTDSSDEDNLRFETVPDDQFKCKTLVYYPNSHDSIVEFRRNNVIQKVSVTENKVIIFNSNYEHRVVINDVNTRRVALTYMFLLKN